MPSVRVAEAITLETHRLYSQCGLPLGVAVVYKSELSAKEVIEAARALLEILKLIREYFRRKPNCSMRCLG